MTFGSLFSGIGGMDLGLERAGMTCKWQVEIDPFCRKVLAKHWPDVPKHDDAKTFPPTQPEDWSVDLIAGGFPCQDISFAGKGAGLAGARSGLWYEFARVVRETRPRYVLVENVAALLVRGLDAVLGTLASDGYDAEWACVPASAVGAPHIRDRVFLLAYADCPGFQTFRPREIGARTLNEGRLRGAKVGNADCSRLEVWRCFGGDARQVLAAAQRANCEIGGQWGSDPADEPESGVGRVAYGVPDRVGRIKGCGNAVVPQVAEWIGRRIMEGGAA